MPINDSYQSNIPGLRKPMKTLTPEERRTIESQNKGPEEKTYIILVYFYDDAYEQTFTMVTGRTDCYDECKHHVRNGADPANSIVLVEGNTIENSVTLYKFLKTFKGVYEDREFDVEDYMRGDSNEASAEVRDVDKSIPPLPEQVGSTFGDQQYSEETDV